MSSLDKVVYVENRRYFGEDHPLRKQRRSFPDSKPEKRSKPEEVNINDVLWDSVAHNRAKNKAQASNVTIATGSWGVNCFVLLPNHDRPNQAFPDLMHNLKNIVCTFFYLITGKGDTLKVRKAEKELGRFPGCWPREKQVASMSLKQKRLYKVGFYNLLLHRNSLELLWHALFMITIIITFENVSGT